MLLEKETFASFAHAAVFSNPYEAVNFVFSQTLQHTLMPSSSYVIG